MNGSVSFDKIEENHIREAFLEVYNRYDILSDYHLIVRQTSVKTATMQAQPIFHLSSFYAGLNTYKIRLATYVRDSQHIRVAELPKEVLIGWFAHELGHVVDYAPYSPLQMMGYGIKYLFSAAFRRSVEHKADEIAIEHGFHEEILSAKKFLLSHDLIDEAYKRKIRKYYMSVEDVNKWIHQKINLHPVP